LAFVAQFSPIGFLRFDIQKSSPGWNEQVVYVYRIFPGPIRVSSIPTQRYGRTLRHYVSRRATESRSAQARISIGGCFCSAVTPQRICEESNQLLSLGREAGVKFRRSGA
jgi:hypothetical protein